MKCFCGRFQIASETSTFYEGSQSKHTARMCVNRSQRKVVLYERGRYEEWRVALPDDVKMFAISAATRILFDAGAEYHEDGYYYWKHTPPEEREAAK